MSACQLRLRGHVLMQGGYAAGMPLTPQAVGLLAEELCTNEQLRVFTAALVTE